jgi:hypothetical protein
MCRIDKLEKKQKTVNLIFFSCCAIFLSSIAARMYFYNDLAVKNRDLKGSFDTQLALEEEITLLKYQDSELSSMSYVESQAVNMGFTPMKERLATLDLSSAGQVASLAR